MSQNDYNDYPKQDTYGTFQDNRSTFFETNTGNAPVTFERLTTVNGGDRGTGWWNGSEVVKD